MIGRRRLEEDKFCKSALVTYVPRRLHKQTHVYATNYTSVHVIISWMTAVGQQLGGAVQHLLIGNWVRLVAGRGSLYVAADNTQDSTHLISYLMITLKPQKVQLKQASALISTDQPHNCNIEEAPQNSSS